jgi:hypothetical protein
VLLSSNLQQKREVVRNHSEDEEMESQEEEEESFGKFTPKENLRDVPDRSSVDLHCKKGQRFSRPQPGCNLQNSPWPGII